MKANFFYVGVNPLAFGERNPLGKAWDENAGMMPMAVVDIFESMGWKWGGRFNRRKDCMHFQATA